ncbi:MAG: NADH-dependent flavin oxidoreductase [Pseudomonadales bacterium]|nr:NADH-dependent flavin oxidoreductase [Pseudomonadales bacterium]
MQHNPKTLTQTFSFANGIKLRNRIAMAPMTTWSANPDGTISDEELDYYRKRSNGVGLVITGCTHVTANGIGFSDEFAGFDDRFIPSLTALADAAKSGGSTAVLQIFHAGNKARPDLSPNGEIVSASTVEANAGPFNSGNSNPRELRHEEILEIVKAFGETTRRAIAAGFDGVELHGAHGFLIQNFLSPRINQRNDEWGGSLENRLRFPLAVVEEVKRMVAEHADRPFLVGYRVSPMEYEPNALQLSDTLELAGRLVAQEIDYIHVSQSDVLTDTSDSDAGQRLTIQQFLDRVGSRLPVIAAGGLRTPSQAEEALDLGLALVAIGKGLVMNPAWVELAVDGEQEVRTEIGTEELSGLHVPLKLQKFIAATPGWFPLSERTQSA